MTVGDWGQSLLYAQKLGDKAYTLVDLGHHLANANIEQIVALLLMEKKLGGFHFNDSKYGDDDLTVGSINPYQLFLIFNELVEGMNVRNMNPVSYTHLVLGKIDLKNLNAHVEIQGSAASKMIKALDGKSYKGRKIKMNEER